MINFQIPNKNQNFRLIVIAAIVGLCWSAMIGGSLLWEIGHQKHAVLLLSATEARASFKKDLIYRKWAADHGGVYVPVTDKTPPNPYLSHIKERDLLTPSGKKLTLVNPAYMTRQVHELGQEQYKIKGHITSLNPIRPQNAPDQWEAEALKILEQGQTEVQSVQIIDGIRYMRLMKPFFTEKPCLKCHASQGYKEGDLRGGVSVSVPLSPYEAIVNKNILMTILVHTAMIILGIVSLVVTSFIINKRNRDRFFVEQALRKSEEKHRKLVSNISDVIVIMDKEGVITYKSSNITEQFGWKPDDLIGKHGLFTVHPDDQEKIGEALTIVLKKDNATVQVEFNYLCKDGSVKPVELTAVNLVNDTVINGVLANYKDITDRKYSEAILKQSEEKYRTMIERSNDMIWTIDKAGNLTFFNEQTERITGLLLSDWIGKPFAPIILKEELPRIMEIFQKCLKGESLHYKLRLKKQDGNILTIAVNTAPTLKNGEINGVVSFGRDMTHQRKLESQLQQSQKMESIGTLAGGIAHDFNNILFPIVGHAEMLLEDVPEDSPLRDSLKGIYISALRAKDLVKQILTFSRQDTNELKLIKMQPIIKEALKLIRSSIPTTIGIKQNIQADCGAIKADPTKIHQIIMNLTTNAYHAMEDTGGELIVSLKEMELEALDLINPEMTPGVYARLIVADTGIGMNKNLTDKIFDPFFTTKEMDKGTGMGLSVVHGIVASMGGAIQVYSEPGKGSEFNVYFPVEKSSIEEQNFQTKEPIQGGTEQILLVDDEASIITMEKQMLERLGYHVTSCTSSIEAIEAFQAAPDKFDLVITDMAMPNMSGDRLAVELVKIRPDIPVLLCTGFSETISEEKVAFMGIKGFLLKPIVMRDLSQKIREVLDGNKG